MAIEAGLHDYGNKDWPGYTSDPSLKCWTLQPGRMAAVHPSMTLCRDSAMAAAFMTALPVYLHGVRQPRPAGAMPFRKLASS